MEKDTYVDRMPLDYKPKTYALSGKLMLAAVVIMFAVVVFILCLHLYARWYFLRARRRHLLRRRAQLVFYVDPNAAAAFGGLDSDVLNSLPVFTYSPVSHPEVLECAVCLSEFEENEKGRLLPKCNHSFHIDCIDMWFHSHSTCPLCRSPVEQVAENGPEVIVSVAESDGTEPGPSDRRKELAIEVPRRGSPDDELGQCSPSRQGFKSPMTRLLSLGKKLSMNRRGAAFSPSGVGTSCSGSTGTELDIERGLDESAQQQTRPQTPK